MYVHQCREQSRTGCSELNLGDVATTLLVDWSVAAIKKPLLGARTATPLFFLTQLRLEKTNAGGCLICQIVMAGTQLVKFRRCILVYLITVKIA